MTLFVLAAALVSTATPAKTIDHSWGVLSRSSHLHGSWRVALSDGTQLAGDWIVVNRENYLARDFGGGGGPAKAIYLVDSKSETVCAFDVDRPYHLYCTGGLARNVNVPAGITLALTHGSTPLDRYQCAGLHCEFRRGGSLEIDVKSVVPTLAQEQLLFERTIGKPISAWLGATAMREGDVLVLVTPFRDVTRLSTAHHYAQEIVEAEATIRLGPEPSRISIRARQTARYVEDCVESEHANMSCMPMPPRCARRQ